MIIENVYLFISICLCKFVKCTLGRVFTHTNLEDPIYHCTSSRSDVSHSNVTSKFQNLVYIYPYWTVPKKWINLQCRMVIVGTILSGSKSGIFGVRKTFEVQNVTECRFNSAKQRSDSKKDVQKGCALSLIYVLYVYVSNSSMIHFEFQDYMVFQQS